MGYTTEFQGRFNLDRRLDLNLEQTLRDFSEERHGGGIQVFPGFPGFWCDWTPTEDGMGIEWNGAEKFYNYVEWLRHIIDHFLKPNNYTLNGAVRWQGEEFDDNGEISVVNNKVSITRR